MKSISTLGTHYTNEHPQLHIEVGSYSTPILNAQLTTFTKSSYSSLTQVVKRPYYTAHLHTKQAYVT